MSSTDEQGHKMDDNTTSKISKAKPITTFLALPLELRQKILYQSLANRLHVVPLDVRFEKIDSNHQTYQKMFQQDERHRNSFALTLGKEHESISGDLEFVNRQ